VDQPYLSLPNLEVKGVLELRGVKTEQRFLATVNKTIDNGVIVEAHFDIDRTKWDIIYGSSRFFEYLGMHMVFDLISVQVKIAAT